MADLFKKPMVYPTDRSEQELLATSNDRLEERLGPSGTIAYMPQCDRLTYAEGEHARRPCCQGDGSGVAIKIAEKAEDTAPITIKLYRLPIEEWSSLPRKTQRNDLKVFDDNTVSILRTDREVFAGPMTWLTTRHSATNVNSDLLCIQRLVKNHGGRGWQIV